MKSEYLLQSKQCFSSLDVNMCKTSGGCLLIPDILFHIVLESVRIEDL